MTCRDTSYTCHCHVAYMSQLSWGTKLKERYEDVHRIARQKSYSRRASRPFFSCGHGGHGGHGLKNGGTGNFEQILMHVGRLAYFVRQGCSSGLQLGGSALR